MQIQKQNQKVDLRPQRQDDFYMKGVLQGAFNARIGLVMVTIICLALTGVIMFLVSQLKDKNTVVIDSSTGRTHFAVALRETNSTIVDRQIVYYSARVAEDFFNFDHRTIVRARQNVYDLAGLDFRQKLDSRGRYVDPNSEEIRQCLTDKTQSAFQWEVQPSVTLRTDPFYSTFMTFQRIVRNMDGSTREFKRYNVKIDWGRLNENVDHFRRPHALVLLNVTVLNEGSIELNEQLNRIR